VTEQTEPPTDSDEAEAAEAAPVASNRVVRVLRTFPFTLGVVALMLVLSVATGTLWNALNQRDLFQTVAYGLPSFQAGRWYTVVTGALFALTPMQYLAVTGGFAVLVGWSEWRLGTRKVAVATISAQLVGILGSALVIALLDGRWDWATRVANDLDVGFSAGALGAVAAASATLLPPWRGRLRFALVLYSVIAFLYIGLLWDLEHLLAVGFGLALGPFLLGRRPALRAPRLADGGCRRPGHVRHRRDIGLPRGDEDLIRIHRQSVLRRQYGAQLSIAVRQQRAPVTELTE